MTQDIYLDTSFVLDCIKFKLPLEEELDRICDFKYRLVTFDLIQKELNNKPNEVVARIWLTKKKVIIKHTPKDNITLDECFLKLPINSIVATHDQTLKKSLKSKQLKSLTIRQKKYLIIT
ncbi:hypothetical protein CL622_08030 [archaeon]|nr:hypothetical protein [archaeon]|tara:strand:+ start:5426 stop:5785 length:360 start_codon:yes stop_codon:yes gene_type:complete